MIRILEIKGVKEKVKFSFSEEKENLSRVRKHFFSKFVEEGREKVMMMLINKFSRLRFEDIEEIFNDGCMVLWEKMNKEDFELEDECLMGYLVNVCRNIGTHYLRNVRDDMYSFDEIMERANKEGEEGMESVFDIIDDCKMETDVKYKKLDYVWEKLSEIDKMILESYYWDGEKMEDIAKKIGYKNGDSVKSKKSKILKKMLEMMSDDNKKGCDEQPSFVYLHTLKRCA